MWRAEVVERVSSHRVVVIIPKLYRQSLVGPVQSAVDAQVGDRVIIADVNPTARTRDWWVVGYESDSASFGKPYPHTHPLGQVEGLNDQLAALTGQVEAKADASMLTGKADAPGPWEKLNLIPAFTTTTGWPQVSYRFTAFGLQLRGRTRLTGDDLALDTVIATIPGFTLPGELNIQVSTMGPGPSYAATSFQLALRADGVLRTRQVWLGDGVYSFAHMIPL